MKLGLAGAAAECAAPRSEALTVVPAPPDDLSAAARAFWFRAAPGLVSRGVLTPGDLPALELLCRDWGEFMACDADVAEKGRVTITDKGNEVQAALLSARNAAVKRIWNALAAFGLTPASRKGIESSGAVRDEIEDLVSGVA